MIYILMLLHSFAIQAEAAWGMPQRDPDHDPRYQRRLRDGRMAVDSCEVDLGGSTLSLNKRATTEELLSLASEFQDDSGVFEQFLKKYRAGEVKIEFVTDSIEDQVANGENIISTFVIKAEEEAIIYANLADEDLGVVASQFYVSMALSLNEDFQNFLKEDYERELAFAAEYERIWDGIASRLSKPKGEVHPSEFTAEERIALIGWMDARKRSRLLKNDRAYFALYAAYEKQQEFTENLASKAPCFSQYADQQLEKNKLDIRVEDISTVLINSHRLQLPLRPRSLSF